jgi:hypothetical protein
LAFALVGLTALALSAPAQAAGTLQLRITASGAPVALVIDQNFGPVAPATHADGSAVDGAVVFNGALGDWSIIVTTGLSKGLGTPADYNAGYAHMDLNAIVSSSRAGTITLELSDTGFSPASSGVLTGAVGGTISGAAGSSGTFSAYKNDKNERFGAGGPTVVLGPFGPGAFSGTGSTSHGPLPTFAMTQRATIVHTTSSSSSFDFEVKNLVPEPASVAMALTAAPLLGLFWLRRHRARA